MSNFRRHAWYQYLLSFVWVSLVTAFYNSLALKVNHTTLALSYLLVVLVAATTQGIGPALVTALIAMLSFNFFFLPPLGSLSISDPQDWLTLLAFSATAIFTSHLSSTARKRAWEAEKSREEVWKLYQLSRAIIVSPDPETAVASLSRQVRDVFGMATCDIYTLKGSTETDHLSTAAGISSISESTLQEVYEKGEMRTDAIGKVYAPLKVGVRVTGVIILEPADLATGTIEAISGLVALALERARFLKELSRTEALRQSDQLKSAILASVSHDLHTPLTSIRAAVDNLLERNLDWDRNALDEFHVIIREEVNRLIHLVQNLLKCARIEAGELHPVKEWGTVDEIFDNVLERSAPVLNNHQVALEKADDMPLVKVDSRLLAEVLANLVENAAKYSPAQSRILLRAEVQDDSLCITVTDFGIGIAAEDRAHLFEKFYRGTNRASSPRDGTGMGLAIAKGIVEAHGGKIWVESPPEKGTTFGFRIPVDQKHVTQMLAANGEEAG
ncbi:MAG: ATP-binding protein [Terriglobia bacterium]